MAYPTLPEGDNGIAAGYTNDVGISGHGSVILHEDFEGYSGSVNTALVTSGPFDGLYQADLHTFAADAGVDGLGTQVLRVEHEEGRYNNLFLNITGVDIVHARVNVKLSDDFEFTLSGGQAGTAHLGITISADYQGAGVTPTGTNHYLALFETTVQRGGGEAQPGYIHNYVYHMDQGSNYGDHLYSDGYKLPGYSGWTASGDFASIDPQELPTGAFHTLEMRVEANTPTQSDGRITMWLDGTIISDIGDIEFRSTTGLKWDRVEIGLGQADLGGSLGAQYVWWDNLVIATEYIGPVYTGTSAPVLSSPVDAVNGATAATGSVSTTGTDGTLYWVVSTSATAPSAAQVKAGNDHTGSAAVDSGSQSVSGSGSQTLSPAPSGLTAETTYYIHFMHESAAAQQSSVSSGDGFTTEAAAATTGLVIAGGLLMVGGQAVVIS